MENRNKAIYLIDDILTEILGAKRPDALSDAALTRAQARTVANVSAKTAADRARVLKRIYKQIDKIYPKSAESVAKQSKAIQGHIKVHGDVIDTPAAGEVSVYSEKYYKSVKKRLAEKFNVPFVWGEVDELAVERVNTYQHIFIKNNYKNKVTKKAHKIIVNTIKENPLLERKAIGDILKSKMPKLVKQKNYFEIVAGQVLNNARTYSNVQFYYDTKIDRYEVLAIIDKRTSQQCITMDGKILEVSRSIQRYKMYDEATSVDDVKAVNPWIMIVGGALFANDQLITPEMTGEELQALGVNGPPYHALCRTTVAAVL